MDPVLEQIVEDLIGRPSSKICKHQAAVIVLSSAVDEGGLEGEERRRYEDLVEALVDADDRRIQDILS